MSNKGFLQGMLDCFFLIGFKHECSVAAMRFVCGQLNIPFELQPKDGGPSILKQMQALNPNVEGYDRTDFDGELEGVSALMDYLRTARYENLGNARGLRASIEERRKASEAIPEKEPEVSAVAETE